MAVRRKQIIIKVTSPVDDSIIEIWKDVPIQFTKELNAGLGECIIRLDKIFDYSGNDLVLGNYVEILIADKDTCDPTKQSGDSNARSIYQGYISLIEREAVGGKETVIVHLLGHYTKLALDILKDGVQTTLYSHAANGLTTVVGSQSAADIGLMMRTVIDRYRVENPGAKIGYFSDDIPDTATTATYRFEQKTYREAMDKLRQLAPVGVNWYIDECGNVKFKAAPTEPTHKFVFGKDFNAVKVEQSMEKVRNFLLIWNGETGGAVVYKHYQDDESIAQFGRRAEAVNDYGVDNSNAADAIGAKFLAENKDAEIKVTVRILDNNESDNLGYDIESIQPGDTCSFYGFTIGISDIFRDNMLISKVVYTPEYVEVEVEAVKSGLLDFQEQQGKAINDLGTGGLQIPETYT